MTYMNNKKIDSPQSLCATQHWISTHLHVQLNMKAHVLEECGRRSAIFMQMKMQMGSSDGMIFDTRNVNTIKSELEIVLMQTHTHF